MSKWEQIKTAPMRMNAYYYSFRPTGVEAIDRILSAVACAGKAHHYTEDWGDETRPYEPFLRGECPVAWIQNAAEDAAATFLNSGSRGERTGRGDSDAKEWMSEWQPIETAPRDGSHILIHTRNHGAVEAWFSPGEWSDNYECGREYNGPVWVCGDDAWQVEIEEVPEGFHDSEATHWRPLPAPPRSET